MESGKRLTINVDQVRIYRHRKCDETEIGTGSSDNGCLRDKSSGFDRVQRRSNKSRDGKKKESEVKRELEEKGLSFRNNQGEKHTYKTNKRGPLIRSIPNSWSEKGRIIKKTKKERLGYKRSHESRLGGPESKVQKGSEHRVLKRNLSSNEREREILIVCCQNTERKAEGKRRKGRNASPYIEERTRLSNKNARREGDQQRQGQERRGTCPKKSLSLEVLVGNANYKS
ncbi:uncharacterized protein TNCV_2968511 [Trichonephila clavipes]|nr:uncharacterized protein TNCV_2968511 [Trichonephila clavipes]